MRDCADATLWTVCAADHGLDFDRFGNLHISIKGADYVRRDYAPPPLPLGFSNLPLAQLIFSQDHGRLSQLKLRNLWAKYTTYVNILSSVRLCQKQYTGQKQKKLATDQSEKVFFKSVSDSVFRQFMIHFDHRIQIHSGPPTFELKVCK